MFDAAVVEGPVGSGGGAVSQSRFRRTAPPEPRWLTPQSLRVRSTAWIQCDGTGLVTLGGSPFAVERVVEVPIA